MGRFLSVDPLAKGYPMLSPFAFAANNPIVAIDLDGLESEEAITKIATKSRPVAEKASSELTRRLAQEAIANSNGGSSIWSKTVNGGKYVASGVAGTALGVISFVLAPTTAHAPAPIQTQEQSDFWSGYLAYQEEISMHRKWDDLSKQEQERIRIQAAKDKTSLSPQDQMLFDEYLEQSQAKLHGNDHRTNRVNYLYAKYDAEGNFLKWGKTWDLEGRYNDGSELKQVASGTILEIKELERELVEKQPGPENHESWAGDRENEPLSKEAQEARRKAYH